MNWGFIYNYAALWGFHSFFVNCEHMIRHCASEDLRMFQELCHFNCKLTRILKQLED